MPAPTTSARRLEVLTTAAPPSELEESLSISRSIPLLSNRTPRGSPAGARGPQAPVPERPSADPLGFRSFHSGASPGVADLGDRQLPGHLMSWPTLAF